jgi:NAD(P)-dependent dehydrogenase (short-subunit alcohol dehydrogenase family)
MSTATSDEPTAKGVSHMNTSPVRFDGQVAAITGSGRGLGREFALLLAARGAAVVINDIGVSADADRYANNTTTHTDSQRDDVAYEVVDEIIAAGGRAVANNADVSNPAGARSIVDAAVSAFGRIDIVINNAGVVITNPFTDLTPADLATSFAVHVAGSMNVADAAWPRMQAQRYGRIVNIASVEGALVGSPGFEAYAAAKGGIVGLTQALARRGVDSNIRVNALLPGGLTRASARSGRKRNDDLNRSAAVVAPSATWLCHRDCDTSGRLFASAVASMRPIFTSVGRGYRSADRRALTVEDIGTHWRQILQREPATTPTSAHALAAEWDTPDHRELR